MLELNGKYNTAKVFTDMIDQAGISQLISMLNQEFIQGLQVRIMPDCHAGKGCVVGTTMTIQDCVVPGLVGIDIGCGMLAIRLQETRIDLPALDSHIRKVVPSGGEVFYSPQTENRKLYDLRCIKARGLKLELAQKSLGTLGGGNHFIEVDRDLNNNLWLIIHTGSRHLGIEICNHYQKIAYEDETIRVNGGSFNDKKNILIQKAKAEGKQRELSKIIKAFTVSYEEIPPTSPYELTPLRGEHFLDYLHDMEIVQEHAALNRQMIAKAILKAAKLHEAERFDTIHNYIDTKTMILRKGSISAQAGEKVLIPMNMRDGCLICVGKGNPDWNFSAPHGAGRLYSRSAARDNISLTEYKNTMQEAGIFTTSVNSGTIDESPMAYKPMSMILENIQDTVSVVDRLVPIYNFKASSTED